MNKAAVKTPAVGKLNPARMAALCKNCFGAKNKKTLVGPGAGLDAGILDMGDGRVMAVAEDPIFPAAGLPLETFGWFTVHIGASDVAVTGIKPEFMTYSLLLPPHYPEKETQSIIKSVSNAAKDLNITIAGGHTGWYNSVTLPTIGGITVWGYAQKDSWTSPGGAKTGDILLMTKGPAIEATALLASLNKGNLMTSMTSAEIEQAVSRIQQISVVQDAATAFSCGGVHAMHDATEGGVLGGIWEISDSSGIPVQADLDTVNVPADIQKTADYFGYDLWSVISEGTLLIAAEPEYCKIIQKKLADNGSASFVLGQFNSNLSQTIIKRNGRKETMTEPPTDQFWNLFD